MEDTMSHATAQIPAESTVGTDHVVQQITLRKVLVDRSNVDLWRPLARHQPTRPLVGRLCVAALAVIPIVALIVAFGFALPHRSLELGNTAGNLTLRDGYTIQRGAGSQASVLEGETFSVLRVLSGAILVKPTGVPAHPLIVNTGDAQVELVDATLCARVQPNTTTLNVLTGSVQLSVNSPAVVSATQNGWRQERSLARPLEVSAGDRVEVTRRGSEVLLRLQRVPGSAEDAQKTQGTGACPPGAASGATLG
jgi:ferric-dicitrate binding protein FerR (iron transport regulator)